MMATTKFLDLPSELVLAIVLRVQDGKDRCAGRGRARLAVARGGVVL